MARLARTTRSKRSEAARQAPRTKPKVPTGMSGWLWKPSAMSTPSAAPSAIMAAAPSSTSSAGWKTSTDACRRAAAQVLQHRGDAEQRGGMDVVPAGMHLARRACWRRAGRFPHGSAARPCRRGSASVGPGRPPSITPTTPVWPTPVRCAMPSRASSAATMPAVRVSSKASSGRGGCRGASRSGAARGRRRPRGWRAAGRSGAWAVSALGLVTAA